MGADLVGSRRDGAGGTRIGGSSTHVDVADEGSVEALVAAAVDFGGGVDGLVNAAGVAGGGPVHMLPAEEWPGSSR